MRRKWDLVRRNEVCRKERNNGTLKIKKIKKVGCWESGSGELMSVSPVT